MSRDGKKTGGRNFAKGQSGNPNGRTPLPQEVREFREAARKDVVEEIKYLWSLSISDLNQIIGKPKKFNENGEEEETAEEEENKTPALRVAIAKVIVNAARDGNMFNLDRILDRVIGKVKEEVDLNHGLQDSFHSKVVDLIEQLDSKGGRNGHKEIDQEKSNKNEKN